MSIVSSNDLDRCLEYSNNDKLYGLGYSAFIRCLVKTMEKELPVEVLDNDTKEILKVSIVNFSINFVDQQEGEKDNLILELKEVESGNKITLDFIGIGKHKVREDKKSSSRSFYRYYVKGSKGKDYRFTFNRRISKNT